MIVDSSSELSAQAVWPVDRIKDHAVKIGSGITPSGGAAFYLDSGIPLLRSQNVHFDGLRLDDVAYISEETHEEMSGTKLHERDVLLNITGASIGRCSFVPVGFGEGNVNQHVCIIRPSARLDYKFLTYCLSAPWGQDQIFSSFTGASRQGLGQRDLGAIQVPLPPLPAQQRIVAYLDASCAAIDAAVAAKRRQLETLGFLRETTIHRVVTLGLNSEAKMKSAGVDWLSKVPAHWCVDRIRDRLGKIVGGEWGDDPDDHDEGVKLPVIRVADIRGLDLIVEGLTIRRIKESKLPGRLIGRHTILLEKSGGGEQKPVGRAVRTRLINFDAICSNFMAKVDCGETVTPDFVVYLLDAMYSRGVNTSCIQQTTGIQNLRVTDYLNIKVGLPPLLEQEQIVAYLDAKQKDFASIVKMLESQIAALTAYRKSLIHECVIGQQRITEADLNHVKAYG